MPKAAFHTLGCKVNQCETAALQVAFAAAGFTIVPPTELADAYIINSCTVTATGERKSLRALRRFRRQNPEAIIALCGCLPQAFPEKAEANTEADIILGTKNRASVLGAVEQMLAGKPGRLIDIPPHAGAGEEPFEELPTPKAANTTQEKAQPNHAKKNLAIPASPHQEEPTISTGTREKTRAFLKIQDGCERTCAYCIIPKARGPLRSRPLDSLTAELKGFIAAGYKEVVLSGVNLGCYGHDLGLTLTDALALACALPGLTRLRLGSLEPDLLDAATITAWAAYSGKLCDQFHLPLQSGCDQTLERMRRPYTTADYCRVAALLREAFPGCAITTDIMTGFPGETEAEHAATLAFIGEMAFARAHIFCYSPRPGTPATSLPGRVPPPVATARAREITALTDTSRREFLRTRIGKIYPVLFEESQDGVAYGHTPCYTPVRVSSPGDISNQILPVRLTAFAGDGDDGCAGELL